MKVFVSGLVGVETTLAVRGFPVTYYPVDYPFFGIKTTIEGSGYRIARGLHALGDEVDLLTLIANDENGARMLGEIKASGLSDAHVYKSLKSSVETVALQEVPFGRRQTYCDLKDAQDARVDAKAFTAALRAADVCVLMNVNYNRALMAEARALGKTVVTDVQNLSDVSDSFNAEFIENSDILFLSGESVPTVPHEFLFELSKRSPAQLIVMGMADDGALLFDRRDGSIKDYEAHDVGAVITTGAGAALLSGFLHYYMSGRNAVDALKAAQVFAALKLKANLDGDKYPTAEQVEAAL